MRVGDASLMRTQVFCHVYELRQYAAAVSATARLGVCAVLQPFVLWFGAVESAMLIAVLAATVSAQPYKPATPSTPP